MLSEKAFKAYDIRGVYPTEVNEEMAYKVGKVVAKMFQAKTVVVGHDIRLSGPDMVAALTEGFQHSGVKVLDIGQCGTEMIYFATAHLGADAGVMVTASHNPAEYNGMKIVREGARPVSGDTGLQDIAQQVVHGDIPTGQVAGTVLGTVEHIDIMGDYTKHLLSYIDVEAMQPLKLIANPGNGGAGPIVQELAKSLPFEFIYMNEEMDGSFPNGVPNPLLEQNRAATSQAVLTHGAQLGIAWDGDFDRCFFFDEKGNFIEGYYLVGLLAQVFLEKQPGAKIMYDPRLTWNTQEIVEAMGGSSVRCKSGHAFMKECMRENEVVYGGEMSAHHYFKDFSYCDSGMIPWLMVAELMSKTGCSLSQMVEERMEKFPCSGEINRKVEDSAKVFAAIEEIYGSEGKLDKMDGISVDFPQWRFNVRASNTEPVVRLNVEARSDKQLLAAKTQELLNIIGGEEA